MRKNIFFEILDLIFFLRNELKEYISLNYLAINIVSFDSSTKNKINPIVIQFSNEKNLTFFFKVTLLIGN